MVEVRYFAAAAELTGISSEMIALGPTATIGELSGTLVRRYGESMAALLKVSAFLLDGTLTRDPAEHVRTSSVDVLPPFAGG